MEYRQTYDYIIAGAGAAGLSLAWHMIHSNLRDKRLLLVDADLSVKDDKTWSFWHSGDPPFPQLIHKAWDRVKIVVDDTTLDKQMKQHTYYSIRSGSFQQAVMDELESRPQVDFLEAPVEKMTGNKNGASLQAGGRSFNAEYIFQSCLTPPSLQQARPRYPVIQHFLGIEVKSGREVFDPGSIILMDFDDTYRNGIAFMYVLPWSGTEALLEYTIFSTEKESPSFYRDKIELYLNNRYGLKLIDFSIRRTEYGEIPMQDLPYSPWYDTRILNIGRAGGLTKPSTGYTFAAIQRHARTIVEQLLHSGRPALPPRSSLRYRAYDLWLLQIIHDDPAAALAVFKSLFSRNELDSIFRFLGEDTGLTEDLAIMGSVSPLPFLKAIWKTRRRLFEL